MSYKKLEIWMDARSLVIEIHAMSLKLPKYELYETGSQIRRSSKSIRSNIVEGYGRRRYSKDYLRFLIYAHSSVDETRDHLETLWETASLTDYQMYSDLSEKLDKLGGKLFCFIEAIERRSQNP
jgi:four helix bundle protein